MKKKTGAAYRIADSELPPPSHSYEFVLAGNGVFLRASQPKIAVQFPLAHCPIRGLVPLSPSFQMEVPRVPQLLIAELVEMALRQIETEILFYLNWEQNHWRLNIPNQIGGAVQVIPTEETGDSYRHALIECHSHGRMNAFFSDQDDQDEQGFRLYAVLGNLPHTPTLRTRVGVFGYFWEICSTCVFELPPGVNP